MITYQYKTLYLGQETNVTDRVNNEGKDGWRVMDICYSDGGNLLTVFLERINEK